MLYGPKCWLYHLYENRSMSAREIRYQLLMRIYNRGITRRIIVGTRIVLISLRMRPRRWRSWRHHRLALGVGYFTLSYSRLEQEFIAQACGLAITRGHILHGRDKKAEYEAYGQAELIDGSGFQKGDSLGETSSSNDY